VGLLTTLKGLPTSYQRDLQEDKEGLFAAHDQVADMLLVAIGALTGTKFREDRLRAAASNPVLFATDAADYLVHKGVPFRKAHDLIGKVLREAETQNKQWTELTLADVQKISPHGGRIGARSHCEFAKPFAATQYVTRSQVMSMQFAVQLQTLTSTSEERRLLPETAR
jgi:argininosuccinate lyase